MNLLPGLRELRAPLAAGYLWLVVAWLTVEPHAPDAAEAEGALASAYRALDLLSTAGVAAALSFAAYLIGSLSSSILTPLLNRRYRRSRWIGADKHSTPLSWQAEESLRQVVNEEVDRLYAELPACRLYEIVRKRANTFFLSSDQPDPIDRTAKIRQACECAVLGDLDVIAKTRLLGRDQELYTEVDRDRAEADFRMAVIPPLMGIAVVLAFHAENALSVAAALTGALLVWFALMRDARRAAKAANQILLQALADHNRRVSSPTLERIEAAAKEQGIVYRRDLDQAARDRMADLAAAGVRHFRTVVTTRRATEKERPDADGGADDPPLLQAESEILTLMLRQVDDAFPAAVAQPYRHAVAALTGRYTSFGLVDPISQRQAAAYMADFEARVRDALKQFSGDGTRGGSADEHQADDPQAVEVVPPQQRRRGTAPAKVGRGSSRAGS